jgi:hypothetical protein
MALIDEVKSRVSTQKLVELTNKDVRGATTINNTTLGFACTDAESTFKIRVGVTFVLANADHLAHIVEGVIIYLMKRTERWNRATQDAEDAWLETLDALRVTIGGNLRLMPETNSEMIASTDKRGVSTTIVRPDFDPTKFDTIRPNAPFSSEDND